MPTGALSPPLLWRRVSSRRSSGGFSITRPCPSLGRDTRGLHWMPCGQRCKSPVMCWNRALREHRTGPRMTGHGVIPTFGLRRRVPFMIQPRAASIPSTFSCTLSASVGVARRCCSPRRHLSSSSSWRPRDSARGSAGSGRDATKGPPSETAWRWKSLTVLSGMARNPASSQCSAVSCCPKPKRQRRSCRKTHEPDHG